jgi:hypothetical protein
MIQQDLNINRLHEMCIEKARDLGSYYRDHNGNIDSIAVTRMVIFVLSWCGMTHDEIAAKTGYMLRQISHMDYMHQHRIERDASTYYATCHIIKEIGFNPDGIFHGKVIQIENSDDAYNFVNKICRFNWPEGTCASGFAEWIYNNYSQINQHYYIDELKDYLRYTGINLKSSNIMPVPLIRETAFDPFLLMADNAPLTSNELRLMNEFYDVTGLDRYWSWEKRIARSYLGLVSDGLIWSPKDINKYVDKVIGRDTSMFRLTEWILDSERHLDAVEDEMQKHHYTSINEVIISTQRNHAIRIGSKAYEYILGKMPLT